MLVPYWISHKMDFPIVFQQGVNWLLRIFEPRIEFCKSIAGIYKVRERKA